MPVELHTFLKQRDVIFTLCAAGIIATQIVTFGELLTNSCVVPIINKHTPHPHTISNTMSQVHAKRWPLCRRSSTPTSAR